MSDGTLHHVEKLLAGEQVSFRPRGNSMKPKITSGALVTLTPISSLTHGIASIKVGDAVLCKVNGRQMLHLVTAIKGQLANKDGKCTLSFQISNNHGFVNGWCPAKNIYGLLTKVEP